MIALAKRVWIEPAAQRRTHVERRALPATCLRSDESLNGRSVRAASPSNGVGTRNKRGVIVEGREGGREGGREARSIDVCIAMSAAKTRQSYSIRQRR